MTVNQDILKSGPYNTDGTTKAFAATFQYLEDSDIVVTLLNTATGATTVGVLNTDYTVVDNVSPIIGGTVTIANNGFGGIANATGIILAGYTITLNPAIPLLQQESYPNAGLFPSAAVEQALDRLTLICQSLQLATTESLKYPVTDSATISNLLPNSTLRASLLLGFDALGNPIATAGTGSVTISSAMTAVVQSTTTQNAAKLLLNGNIASLAPVISDTNVFEQWTANVNSYAQVIYQNTNNGATASTDIVVNNNLGTSTTFFGNFGMNSSGFTGSGAFNQASAVYLTSTSGDLAIGTTTANAVHFVYNGSATDSMTINASGVTIPNAIVSNMNGGQLAGFRNRIINGDMRIDQRNAGASGTAAGYTIDRWNFAQSVAGKFSWGQNLGAVLPPVGAVKYFGIKTTSAYTPLTTDNFSFYQQIEGQNVQDLAFGTANAKSVTVSFWVYSSLTGNFGAFLQNANGSPRTYPFLYNIPVANTWTKITQTIPGDVTGTWPTDTTIGLGIAFSVGAGPSQLATPNVWTNTNPQGVTGQTNTVATLNAVFNITQVQVEAGSVATPFEQRTIGAELALCQRYYYDTNPGGTSGWVRTGTYAPSGGGFPGPSYALPVSMRSVPTVTIRNSVPSGVGTAVNLQASPQGNQIVNFWFSASGTGTVDCTWNFSAVAEL